MSRATQATPRPNDAVVVVVGKYLATGRHRARLIAAGWSLSVVVLIHFYMANLISILTVPSYEALVDSIEDVAAKPHVKFSTIRSTAVDAAILVTHSAGWLPR